MRLFLLHLLLTFAWLALTGLYSFVNFACGFVLSFWVIWLLYRGWEGSHYLERLITIPGFILFFLWDLIKANFRVAHDALTPRYRMRPAIVAVPLDVRSDLEITVLAMLITLTPGTLSLDLSEDHRVLFVHALYVDDTEAFRQSIKEGLEKRVAKVFR